MTRRDAAGTGAARFVSRGGDKLQSALDRFRIPLRGRRALDAGASTGGFTDCLLANGVAEVVAVDVAYGMLAWPLRNDPRVKVLERTNVRTLDPAAIGDPVDLVVADLAFISLKAVRDALLGAARPAADLVLLVKPQFEAPREQVERGGVVRDPAVWAQAMRSVVEHYRAGGCRLTAACASPLTGPAGNREFFLHLINGPEGPEAGAEAIDAAIKDAP